MGELMDGWMVEYLVEMLVALLVEQWDGGKDGTLVGRTVGSREVWMAVHLDEYWVCCLDM